MYNKKTLCFLLLAFLLTPRDAFCVKGREVVFAITGGIVFGAGVTLMIKSAKDDKKNTTKIEINPWLPMTKADRYALPYQR